MLLRPLKRAPMMLGGVGFQVGLDRDRRRRAAPPAPDVVDQIKRLEALRDEGALTADEFQLAKRKILGL